MVSQAGPIIPLDNKTKSPEPVENTLFTHYSDTPKNKGITDKEPASNYEITDDGQLTY
jgi:hypothetical protein